MKIILDLDTNEITVPKNYFKSLEKQNSLIEKVGGEKIKPMDLIKKSFEIAMSDTDKYLHTRGQLLIMTSKGTRVTQKEILKMVELYEKHGNFTKVGKIMRRSPDTVSKYVNQWFAVYGCYEALTRPPIKHRVVYSPITSGYEPFHR